MDISHLPSRLLYSAGFALIVFLTGCSGDGRSNPAATSEPGLSSDQAVLAGLLGPEDLNGGWAVGRTMDSAPTIGCSGPVPAGEYGAGVLLEDTSGRDEILLQGIVVLSDEEAVEFLENLPCNGDPSLSRLQLADDEARIRAFRSQFETNPNYMVDLVFIRRGELLTFFSFQQLASRDQTQQVARRADDKLALVAEELADN